MAMYVVKSIFYYDEHSEFLWTDLELVWFTDRNKLIHENGTLNLLPDGNLVLRDADGTLVWSTITSNKSVIGM